MKRFLVILFLTLFWSSKVYAGLFDVFKEPVEICMDRFKSAGKTSTTAARYCSGITKAEAKCMVRLVEDGKSPKVAVNNCEED